MFSTMKIRSVFLAILLTLVAVAVAGPTAAQAKVPGIKSTPEYKTLKRYVSTLQAKRNTTAPPARKAAYRSELASKRTAATSAFRSCGDDGSCPAAAAASSREVPGISGRSSLRTRIRPGRSITWTWRL